MNALGGRIRKVTFLATGRASPTYLRSPGPGDSSQLGSPHSYGDESLRVEGRWLEPFPDLSPELVFGADARGGGFSADPRLRVVSWAAIVGVVKDGRLIVLGKASGRMPPGSSVAQGEARALVFVLSRVGGRLPVVSDSKAAISSAAVDASCMGPGFSREAQTLDGVDQVPPGGSRAVETMDVGDQ